MFSPIPSLPRSYCKSHVSHVGCTIKDVQIKISCVLPCAQLDPTLSQRTPGSACGLGMHDTLPRSPALAQLPVACSTAYKWQEAG